MDHWNKRILERWNKFLATDFGVWLTEYTPTIRLLSSTHRGEHNRLLFLVLVMSPLLVLDWVLLCAGLVGSALLFFLIQAVVVSLIFAVFWIAYKDSPERLRDSLNTRKGLLSRRNVQRFISVQALRNKALRVLPENPEAFVLPVGYAHHIPVGLDLESPSMIVAPARSGKTTNVASVSILAAPGPVVTTSSRKDIIDSTAVWRKHGFHDPVSNITHKGGKVYVFDPQNVCHDSYAHTLKWNPIIGCEDPHIARIRATALVSGTGLSGENQIWNVASTTVLQALMHAAAISHATMGQLVLWSKTDRYMPVIVDILDPTYYRLKSSPSESEQVYLRENMQAIDEKECRKIIANPTVSDEERERAKAELQQLQSVKKRLAELEKPARLKRDVDKKIRLLLEESWQWRDLEREEEYRQQYQTSSWAADIVTVLNDDPRLAGNKLFGVQNAFAALSEPKVLERFDFSRDDPDLFDMRAFLKSNDTLYLLSELKSADGKGASTVGGFVSMLLSSLVLEARNIAAADSHGRLTPPLLLVLDEIANIDPWVDLPQVFSAGSGDGISAQAFFQSRSQAQAVYGEKDEQAMWDSAQKLLLGGGSDEKKLEELSQLIGKRDSRKLSKSWNKPTSLIASVSESVEHDTIISVEELRQIPVEQMIMLAGRLPATVVNTVPIWKRKLKPLEYGGQ